MRDIPERLQPKHLLEPVNLNKTCRTDAAILSLCKFLFFNKFQDHDWNSASVLTQKTPWVSGRFPRGLWDCSEEDVKNDPVEGMMLDCSLYINFQEVKSQILYGEAWPACGVISLCILVSSLLVCSVSSQKYLWNSHDWIFVRTQEIIKYNKTKHWNLLENQPLHNLGFFYMLFSLILSDLF